MQKQALVVDDNCLSRSLIGYYLKSLGFAIFEVEDGADLIQQVRERRFDIIVLDWNMPQINGFDALVQGDRAIHQLHDRGKKIPVMIYTNMNVLGLKIPECVHFSVKATLSKQLTPFQQFKKIKKIVEVIK